MARRDPIKLKKGINAGPAEKVPARSPRTKEIETSQKRVSELDAQIREARNIITNLEEEERRTGFSKTGDVRAQRADIEKFGREADTLRQRLTILNDSQTLEEAAERENRFRIGLSQEQARQVEQRADRIAAREPELQQTQQITDIPAQQIATDELGQPVSVGTPEQQRGSGVAKAINLGSAIKSLSPFNLLKPGVKDFTDPFGSLGKKLTGLGLLGGTALGAGALSLFGGGTAAQVGTPGQLITQTGGVTTGAGVTGYATNPASVATTTSMLTKLGLSLGAATLVVGAIGSYPFAKFELAESMDKIGIAMFRASQEGDTETVQELASLMEEMSNPSTLDKILSWIPYANVWKAAKINAEAAVKSAKVFDQLAKMEEEKRRTGKSDDQIWEEIHQANDDRKEQERKDDEAYWSDVRDQIETAAENKREADLENRKEDAKYWDKVRKDNEAYWDNVKKKDAELKEEQRRAENAYWEEVRRQQYIIKKEGIIDFIEKYGGKAPSMEEIVPEIKPQKPAKVSPQETGGRRAAPGKDLVSRSQSLEQVFQRALRGAFSRRQMFAIAAELEAAGRSTDAAEVRRRTARRGRGKGGRFRSEFEEGDLRFRRR